MAQILDFGPVLLLIIGVFAALALWLILTGLWRLLHGKILRGPVRAGVGVLLAAIAVAVIAVSMNIRTYQRLDYEKPVAWIEFQQIGPQQYQALLHTADGNDQVFAVYGDEWQIDARVLKWKGAAAVLGLDPRYRLERFSGRYVSTHDEKRAARSVFGLIEGEPGLDVWKYSQAVGSWLPLVDTVYGSAAFMPMRDGTRFQVLLTEDGLIAREAN